MAFTSDQKLELKSIAKEALMEMFNDESLIVSVFDKIITKNQHLHKDIKFTKMPENISYEEAVRHVRIRGYEVKATIIKFNNVELEAVVEYFEKKLEKKLKKKKDLEESDEKLREILNKDKQELLRYINDRTRNNEFPREWRRAEVVHQEAFYMHIDPYAKVFEKLIVNRLEDIPQNWSSSLATSLDEVNTKVKGYVDKEIGAYLNIGVYLNIKHAYPTTPYKCIIKGLEDLDTPEYLLNLIRSYFIDRRIIYGGHEIHVYGGLTIGAVISKFLFKVATKDIVGTQLDQHSELIALNDTYLLMVKGKTKDELLENIRTTTIQFERTVESSGFKFNEVKTQAVLLTEGDIDMVTIFNNKQKVTVEREIDFVEREKPNRRSKTIGVDARNNYLHQS